MKSLLLETNNFHYIYYWMKLSKITAIWQLFFWIEWTIRETEANRTFSVRVQVRFGSIDLSKCQFEFGSVRLSFEKVGSVRLSFQNVGSVRFRSVYYTNVRLKRWFRSNGNSILLFETTQLLIAKMFEIEISSFVKDRNDGFHLIL
jgi:hypothetical protein